MKKISKIEQLKKLIENDQNWKNYLTQRTTSIIETVIKTNNIQEAAEKMNIIYITVRSNIIKAIERIENKTTEFKREGKTKFAEELFRLMNTVENWEQYVTPEEAKIAKYFQKYKNFYEVSRHLNVKPGNVASALYGNTQRFGAITKIKNRIKQKKRFIKKEAQYNEC